MEQSYSSTHSESRNWMEISSLLHAPTALLRERTLVPIELPGCVGRMEVLVKRKFFAWTVQTVA